MKAGIRSAQTNGVLLPLTSGFSLQQTQNTSGATTYHNVQTSPRQKSCRKGKNSVRKWQQKGRHVLQYCSLSYNLQLEMVKHRIPAENWYQDQYLILQTCSIQYQHTSSVQKSFQEQIELRGFLFPHSFETKSVAYNSLILRIPEMSFKSCPVFNL